LRDDFILVEKHIGYTFGFTPVGIYSLSDLPGSTINQVPQELYSAPLALLREDAQRNVPDREVTIIPTNNPLGYLSQPPVVLTTLPAAKFLAQRDDYISAVRIRVAGVETAGEASQRKIERVAREIEERTGLQVDITLGSSPQPMLVDVQGSENVEALGKVEELWVRQLVGITLQRDFTRFDTLLFAAMFFSFGIFMYTSAALNLVGRQGEIGVLKTVGWKDKHILGYLLSEALLLAFITGCIAFAATLGITALLGHPIALDRAGLVFPLMLGLFVLGTALPFAQAARRSPLSLLGLGELREGKGQTSNFNMRSLPGRNISKQRARFATATLGLIPAFLALILFFFITLIMAGELSGSLLGQHIQVLIQPYHYVLMALILLVGQLILMNISGINIKKRQNEIGVLQTAGWKPITMIAAFLKETLYSTLGSALLAAGITIGLLSLLQRGFQLQFLWAVPLGLLLAGVMSLIAMLYPRHLVRKTQVAELLQKRSS
jgi:ABC-type antimicrobial peptide transport system permease subunit